MKLYLVGVDYFIVLVDFTFRGIWFLRLTECLPDVLCSLSCESLLSYS